MRYLNNYTRPAFLLLSLLIFSTLMGLQSFNKAKNYTVLNTWQLPDKLDEVSGIAWVDDQKMLMVEDEHATLYLYDLKAKKLEREIPFGEDGDFEGVALHKTTAFAMRSDGKLFTITNYLNENPSVLTYQTPFSHKSNVETLEFDSRQNQLLIAPKDDDPNDSNSKGIYAFDLKKHEILPHTLFRIEMNDKALEAYKSKKAERTFRPSDLAVHPQTGELYVLEGVHPKLLIMTKKGAIKSVFKLDKKHFPQPEGITFSPDGRLFISSEGHGGSGSISEISLSE